jgi:predicted lipid-binding transport protein (Tim44 family)
MQHFQRPGDGQQEGLAMGTAFGAIVGWYLLFAFIASIYFWAKRTDRSQTSFERRLTAAGYGMAWPYFAFKGFKAKQEQAARDGAPGAAAPAPAPGTVPLPGTTQPPVQDPFAP